MSRGRTSPSCIGGVDGCEWAARAKRGDARLRRGSGDPGRALQLRLHCYRSSSLIALKTSLRICARSLPSTPFASSV